MTRAYIGIGSNIDPMENVPRAIRLLDRQLHILAISTFYRNEALGPSGYPPFINGVIEIETEVPARDLKYGLLRLIEKELGRHRSSDRNAPRTIDLDLLVYGEQSIRSEDLVLPDPEIAERSFLAVPLCELAPDLIPQGFGRTVREIADLFGFAQLERLDAFTDAIRKDILDE
jgi:2-amino-4-hydroxy-6-hydroxymethyldihydropteridine diphosphokinase